MKPISLITIALLLLTLAPFAQDEATPDAKSPDILRLEIRVIFSGQTGIYGSLPRELADMKQSLTEQFDYPHYDLANTIHLNVFTNDEAVAMVFPEHFLRIIPKGSAQSGYKLKAELYNAQDERALKTRLYADSGLAGDGGLGIDLPAVSVEEKRKEGEHSTLFPIVSSAVLAQKENWDAFGGVPVFVNAQEIVRSNRMSTGNLGTSQPARGQKKFLILGIRLK